MNSPDQFRERVQALVAEGKLTPEEADQLLSTAETTAESATTDATAAPLALVLQPVPVPEGPIPATFHLHVTGYSLTVRVDPEATMPQLTATLPDRLELAAATDGWHLRRLPTNWNDRGEGWLERIIQSFTQEGNLRAELVIPALTTDIHAKVQGGNLTMEDTHAQVHVVVQGGNLTMGNAREVRAKVQGGNLKWSADLQDGQHDVKVQGGNASVQLRPGSSVRVAGSVTAGNMSATGFPLTKHARDFVNADYEGVLSDGRARLDLKVQGGNAKVVAQ